MRAERLQKILARAGVASRRAAERLITDGRVTVNGVVVRELGTKAVPGVDEIALDGEPVAPPEPHVYLILHKPRGCLTTMKDPLGRPTVRDFIPDEGPRVFPVGRLDFDVDGPLLFTNDGELANGLQHPAGEVEKLYLARVEGRVGPDDIDRLRAGIMLEDGATAPAKAGLVEASGEASVVRLAIHEGRRRQVKRMFRKLGHPVIWLTRLEFAGLGVEGLGPGEVRKLSEPEVDALYLTAGLTRSAGKD
jgi:23S rRNA pseudouridine2605 synthase